MLYSFSQLFANQRPSALYQEFLQREGVGLEEILEHEDTVTELRKGNPELLRCLRAQVPALISCISEGKSSREKVPFVAAEILTSEVFMNEVNCDCLTMPLFFQFLQVPSPLNDTIAGYNVRVCLKLLERQEVKVADFLLASSQHWTALLLGHLQSRAVAELLFELLCVNGLTEERQTLLKGVMGQLAAGERQVAVNAGWIGAEVLRKADNVGEWKRLVGVLLSKDVLQTLGSVITTETAGDQAAVVLCALTSHYSFQQVLAPLLSPQSHSLQALTDLLHTSALYLSTPITTLSAPTSYGDMVPPLGSTRLQLLQLLLCCLKALGPLLESLLQATHFLETCTKLFLAYPWHSSLHIAYFHLVKTVLEGSSQSLKDTLMEDIRLVELLACLGSGRQEGHRKGYMGQVTQMGNTLLAVSRSNSYFQQFLCDAVWTDFCQNYLFPQTKVENTQFLSTPRIPSDDEMEYFLATDQQIPNEPLTLEELDQQNPFDLWGYEDTPPEDLRDLYSAVNYWKVPVRSADLEDLD